MNTIIKISIAAFLLIALNTKAQHSTKFKEFNAGVHLGGLDEDMFVHLGGSYLWGKQHIFLIIFCLIMSMGLHFHML